MITRLRSLMLFPLLLCTIAAASGATASGSQTAHFVAKAPTLSPVAAAPSQPAVIVQETVVRASTAPVPQVASEAVSGGSSGSVLFGDNCVACVRAMTGRSQNGNAGTWAASSSTPWIGAIMIFRPGQQGAGSAGHVGVVVGVHGNMIELAHCHWSGGQTEFYSTGLFW